MQRSFPSRAHDAAFGRAVKEDAMTADTDTQVGQTSRGGAEDSVSHTELVSHGGPPSQQNKMFVVAPMVDQSELPFRMLCRQYGATLAYTPMLHARNFVESAHYRRTFLTTTPLDAVRARMEAAADDEAALRKQGARSDGGTQRADSAPTMSTSLSTEHNHRDSRSDEKEEAKRCEQVIEDEDDEEDEEEEAERLIDRPCIVQFCGHDADVVCRAAQLAVGETDDDEAAAAAAADKPHTSSSRPPLYRFDAVDLNLGCPQGIARRGRYGSFLMEEWDVIHTLVHTCHVELPVPVTVKIRVFDTEDARPAGSQGSDDVHNGAAVQIGSSQTKPPHMDEALTLAYAHMLCDAGAQLITVHGRTRAMKGQLTGLAHVAVMKAVTRAMQQRGVAVFTNGNVRDGEDVHAQLQDIGSDGVMVAESLLWDAGLFAQPRWPIYAARLYHTVTMPPSPHAERASNETTTGATHVNDVVTAAVSANTSAVLCTGGEHGSAAAATTTRRIPAMTQSARLRGLSLARAYCRWLRRCQVAEEGMAKAHLFKMAHYSYERVPHMRAVLAGITTPTEHAAGVSGRPAGAQWDASDALHGTKKETVCSQGGRGEEKGEKVGETTQKAGVSFVQLLMKHLDELGAAESRVTLEEHNGGMPTNSRRCEKEARRAAAAWDAFDTHATCEENATNDEETGILTLFV